MTRALAKARDETRQSQQQMEEQRTYLEAVLTRLSSGVLTIDSQAKLYTANKMAEYILNAELSKEIGNHIEGVSEHYPYLGPVFSLLVSRFAERREDWREELTLFGPSGRQILVCRGTLLPNPEEEEPGHLLVFDDLTTLIEAQRNQAWSEVARRLAHEIKNPLTPIQLSAERLRHKYLSTMVSEDSATLDRLTRTIIQQVEGMKEMVNAFSDYARGPRNKSQLLDLNDLIRDVAELYNNERDHDLISLHFETVAPEINADPNRMRQIFHNLIKNALEAKIDNDKHNIRITTIQRQQNTSHLVEISVEDNGRGLPSQLADRLFEPYISSKPKGGGLGLAIVKKIVEEHGGIVWAENRMGEQTEIKGARIVIRFPALDAHPLSNALTQPKH